MVKKIKQVTFMVSLGILAILLLQSYAYSAIWANHGETVFASEDGTTATGEGNIGVTAGANASMMRTYIAESAGFFLKSQASMLRVLDKVEMADLQGFDYYGFQSDLCSAIEDMEMARFYHTLLRQTAEGTPYNPDKIKLLVSLDFDRFRAERGLNAVIFQEVRNYLGKGNVTDFFGYLLSRTEIILDMLYKIRATTDLNQLPSIEEFWALNQVYSDSLMAGQYSAQLFYEVKKNSQ